MLMLVEGGTDDQLHITKNQLVFGGYSRKMPARRPFL